MLTKDCFRNNFIGACVAKGFTPTDKESLVFLYDIIKDEFTDEEFTAITKDVVLNENFYGKMPDISLWTKRKKKSESVSENAQQAEARQNFIDKVMDLATMSYIPNDWKKELMDNLTPCESKALAEYGGINAVWQSMHKGGAYNGEQEPWVIKALTEKFNANYNAQAESSLKIGVEADTEMAAQIADLTGNLLKRIN